jgi:hypothetical protein
MSTFSENEIEIAISSRWGGARARVAIFRSERALYVDPKLLLFGTLTKNQGCPLKLAPHKPKRAIHLRFTKAVQYQRSFKGN